MTIVPISRVYPGGSEVLKPRKIIFSRKGFDTSSGGCPSPILPDGRLLSLPIPDTRSKVRFGDIEHSGINLSDPVKALTKGRLDGASGAHIDPDLNATAIARQPGWRPVFGQSGAAQGHLHNQQVGAGDLFVFFGLFRPVLREGDGWRFDPASPARHVIWGWLQVGDILKVDQADENLRHWAEYHPHFRWNDDPSNTLYLPQNRLEMGGGTSLSGSGCFKHFSSSLQLTDRRAERPGIWALPRWCFPKASGEVPLSYHGRTDRWRRDTHQVVLQAVSRGQEFVLDTQAFPEAVRWMRCILTSNATLHD